MPELHGLPSLAESMESRRREHAFGHEFIVFMDDPSPIGKAASIEDLRIGKEDLGIISHDLVRASPHHPQLTDPYRTEGERLSRIMAEPDGAIEVERPPVSWFLVDARWDVYPNLMSLQPWWKLGTLKEDTPRELVRRFLDDETLGQRALCRESRQAIASRYGDFDSDRIHMSEREIIECYDDRRRREECLWW